LQDCDNYGSKLQLSLKSIRQMRETDLLRERYIKSYRDKMMECYLMHVVIFFG